MDELEYRVVFKDGTHGLWHSREAITLGNALLTRLSLDAPGEVLTVEVRALEEFHCSRCERAVEDLGLCFEHLNEELDIYNARDPWPDFHDELPGMWDQSDLSGGWADVSSD